VLKVPVPAEDFEEERQRDPMRASRPLIPKQLDPGGLLLLHLSLKDWTVLRGWLPAFTRLSAVFGPGVGLLPPLVQGGVLRRLRKAHEPNRNPTLRAVAARVGEALGDGRACRCGPSGAAWNWDRWMLHEEGSKSMSRFRDGASASHQWLSEPFPSSKAVW
jgi:hypothetical protein